MRVNYWSNSKLIKRLRVALGFPVPLESGTSEEWCAYSKECKQFHKTLDWLTDDFIDRIQDVVYWPKDKLETFAYWVYHRFVAPSHMINTRLEKGKWHETDEKILHGMFEELVDFVQIQKANMASWSENNKWIPWYDKYLPYFLNRFFETRSEHLGIQYLLWEVSLKKDDEWFGVYPNSHIEDVANMFNNPDYMRPTSQSEAALEILDLYCWWQYIHPTRPDPMDASGYSDYFERRRQSIKDEEDECGVWELISDNHDEWKQYSDECHRLEQLYEQEDEANMIRLIKIRRSLWT